MRKVSEKIAESFNCINPVSKVMLLSVIIIFEVLFTAAICALLLAGRGFDYWRCIMFAKDAIDCIRPSTGVLLLGSLLVQAVYTPKEDEE